MYITSNTAVLEASIPPGVYKVYLLLCQYANNRTRECFVSKHTIAVQCGISLSGVVRATRLLVQRGLLRVASRFTGSGRQTSNLYTLLDCPRMSFEDGEESDEGKEKVSPAASETKARLFPVERAAASLPPLPCRVYSYLASLGGRAGECAVSRKKIAAACGTAMSTVSKVLSLLCREGFLRRVRQTRWGKFRNKGTAASRYILTAPTPRLSRLARLRLLFAALVAGGRQGQGWGRTIAERARKLFSSLFGRDEMRDGGGSSICDTLPLIPGDTPGTTVRTKVTVIRTVRKLQRSKQDGYLYLGDPYMPPDLPRTL